MAQNFPLLFSHGKSKCVDNFAPPRKQIMYAKGHGIKAILLFFGHGTVINNFIHSFAKNYGIMSHVFKKAFLLSEF